MNEEMDSVADVRETEFLRFSRIEFSNQPKRLTTYLDIFRSYNPLDFFQIPTNQTQYPRLYQSNQVILAVTPTSIFQESVFSSTIATLSKRRFRLEDSPELLQAVVVLRYIYGQQNKEKETKTAEKQPKQATLPFSVINVE